ncbi:putative transcription factor bZIP family [Medicago truncatula]|uniref:Putative transcription factor bZIP family n=1 Tax=Medicago truncatula TaxID=3880 RepID=A0A396JP80_MEDTR|nr:bZIP transcription factor TGA10 [Medicago truncatula]RHN79212.1 putative transcription factor bZIP family [Medicago truncatula]
MGFSLAFEEAEQQEQVDASFLGTNNNSMLMASKNSHESLQQQQNLLHHHQQQQQNQHHPHHMHDHQISFGMMPSSSSSSMPSNYLNKDSSAYDLGELDQAFFLYLDGQAQADPSNVPDQRQNSSSSGMKPPPTLNIFPSQPMHVAPPPSNSKVSMGLTSPITSGSKKPSQPSMELANQRNENPSAPAPPKPVKKENNRKGTTSSSEHEGPKTPDPKTLRRLAQNREAARKSRLRKKAYVQQLETSRIKLNQLEQELQRARAQGVLMGGGAVLGGDQGIPISLNSISSEAAMFDVEYGRWLEEHHRLVCELRAALDEHLHENELRLYVENCLAHYDQVINLKNILARTDVFHLVFGMWKTPAERCFMWIGGFRPSELIKIIVSQIEPLTEHQILGICGLQQSTQEAEEALSQGLDALNQSLSETITSDSLSNPPNMANYMGQMALAMNKLSTLESFVRQADNLRHQTVHRLHQLLTVRQAARCLVAMSEYFHRLRALSSLWLTRPRQE